MTEPEPASALTNESDNRRSADRAQCTIEVAISSVEAVFQPATVLDLSRGGVKLLADPPPAPGDEVKLTFLASDGRLFQMSATVLHYTEYGTGWAVGCKFVRELSDKELSILI